MTGLVRKVVRDSSDAVGGYGFIRSDERIDDFFFPLSYAVDEIRAYDTVDFWLDDNPHKPGALMAVDVTRRRPRCTPGARADTD